MGAFIGWLRRQLGGVASASDSNPSPTDTAPAERLDRARALARDGQLHEAARVYHQLKRKHETVDLLLEYADLLLDMGDRFGAATNAVRVLELDPENSRAIAIRKEILRLEQSERAS